MRKYAAIPIAIIFTTAVHAGTGDSHNVGRAEEAYYFAVRPEARCVDLICVDWDGTAGNKVFRYDFDTDSVPFRKTLLPPDSGIPDYDVMEYRWIEGFDEALKCSSGAPDSSSQFRFAYVFENSELVRVIDRCPGGAEPDDLSKQSLQDGDGIYTATSSSMRLQVIHDGSYAYVGHAYEPGGTPSGTGPGLKIYDVSDLDRPVMTDSFWKHLATTNFNNMVKYGNTIFASYGLFGVWQWDVADKHLLRRGRLKTVVVDQSNAIDSYAAGVRVAFKHLFVTHMRSYRLREYRVLRIYERMMHLRMDDGSGSICKDMSGHKNHGTLRNNPSWIGEEKGGLRFDGHDDFVSVENPGIYGSMMTACLWMKADSKQDAALIAKAAGPELQQHHWMLAIDKQQRLRGVLRTAGTTSELFSEPQSVPLHTWVHIAMTYHDGQWTLYIDGEEAVSASKSGMIGFNDTIPVTIGSSPLGEEMSAFSGRIREVQLYDYDLEPHEIADLSWNPQPVRNSASARNSPIRGEIAGVRYFDLRGRRLPARGATRGNAGKAIVLRQVTTSRRAVYTEKMVGK